MHWPPPVPDFGTTAELEKLRAGVSRHLTEDVLAWWLRHGPDDARGGVFTCWSNDNSRLLSRDKYTWSQGRWIWLMARLSRAARLGLVDLDGAKCLERAERTALFLESHALLPDGSTAFLLAEDGMPKEPEVGGGLHTSVFADLFVALGFAALSAETGSDRWGEAADRLLQNARDRILAGRARTEPYPVPTGFGSFALPMILVGVGAEVHAATGSHASAGTVIDAIGQIEGEFLQGADVFEMKPADPELADTLLARHRTPGHVLEACWFFLHAGEMVRDRWAFAQHALFKPDVLADIAVHAATIGWDTEAGGLFRYVDRDGGEPRGRLVDDRYERLVQETWDTKLWWPHAEALYTMLLLHLETGREDVGAWYDRLSRYISATFPGRPGEEWIQIRDRQGAPLTRTVALPVKDPFHIARSLLLILERLPPQPASSPDTTNEPRDNGPE
ncbi:N-acylglucosamine 2-epimerase [Faunimonas pinastri]|uniref:N-acylglucosamine 2-epimerase n=1 Tax=Faunimonas pinastri TaxID=1855383 RepID=A0A1H9K4J8_9HYPH|nr:AGE family epimerase/isomerase [Faunimonas pinastri]SEQ94009.1 N-acylglucosamine 2-epimerase [Faunimonas pinastri]